MVQCTFAQLHTIANRIFNVNNKEYAISSINLVDAIPDCDVCWSPCAKLFTTASSAYPHLEAM